MRELPTGTVTFLFTDIEGSVALWEADEVAMSAALARLDVLLAGAIKCHAGTVLKSVGDGALAVFVVPVNAVAAAIEIQRVLAAEVWATSTPIRSRIAIATGEAVLRNRDYYGAVANRCARLLGLARGQQTLLTEATATLVADALPTGASLVDLGEQHLRGLRLPEHVFELALPDLP